jgi:choice-of-anchor B domain-containing protein
MRLYIFLFSFLPLLISAQNSYNLSLLGDYEWSNTEGSDIWGWVDQNGDEFALVGLNDGFSVVDVSNPTAPIEMFYISDLNSTWRDIKTWGNYAYVTTEADAGLLIVDLSDMSGNTYWHVTNFSNPNTGNNVEFTAAHNIYIDENGIAYIFGASSNTGSSPADGVIFLDVAADALAPHYLGEWDDYYIHDGMTRGDTMYAGCIYEGELYIVDVSDKTNPQTLGHCPTPNNFTHNAWVSDNGNFVFTTDEQSDSYIGAYDITNITNIQEVDRIQSNPGSLSVPHNTHVDGNFLITSWYRDGTTIHDVTYPNNMIQVGYYDSYSGSGNGFDGCWGTYPFFPSGNIISSDINSSNNGTGKLLVYRRDFLQACYLEGNVTDLSSGLSISGAGIEILNTNIPNNTTSNLNGDYFTGTANSSTYDVVFSKAGYLSDTISTALNNGLVTVVNVALEPLVSFNITGMVVDISGVGIPDAQVLVYNSDFTFSVNTDNNGNFNINSIYEGNYNIVVGKWGYVTYCDDEYISPSSTISISLQEGYYDDFTFDFGWIVSGGVGISDPGRWERGQPEGTSYQGLDFNPSEDINTDCFDYAYVTGLTASGSAGGNDVDDYNTILESPVFSLPSNQSHYLEYYSWFSNGGGGWGGGSSPNDSLTISVSNGNTTAILEITTSSSADMGKWNFRSFDLAQYLPVTSTMQIIIETADWDALGGHLVEAGFDMFQINSSASTNIKDNSFLGNKKLLKIVDLLGREVVDLKNAQLFYIYDDGTVDHKMIID